MVLVTGGTGLVGSHLLLHLLRLNLPVRAIHRPNSNLNRVKKVFGYYNQDAEAFFQKIEWVVADINDIPALEDAFEDIDQVYHAAALISFDPKSYSRLLKVNAEGTANIVNLCLSFSVQKLCYVSSIATIGGSLNGEKATEESEFSEQHTNVYARAKYAAELEVWRGSQEGLSVVMVNPGIIVGPGFWETGSGALFTTAQKGYSFYPPGGSGFVSVHDVVRMMQLLMNSDKTSERYIAVSENLPYQSVLTTLTKQLGIKAPTRQLAFWQLNFLRVLDAFWCFFTRGTRKLTKSDIYSLRHRSLYDNTKIQEHLNFQFETLETPFYFSCERFIEENRSKGKS